MIEIQEARPPYVQFEMRAVEDRAASQEQGHYVAKDVVFAIITPAGSRDRYERIADEWLRNMADQVRQERLPAEWLSHYKKLLAAWREGREAPESGTPVRNWPVVSPAQVEMLINLRIRTVEDLAVCNEEAITRMGMGGRSLKQKAVDWLASAANTGKEVEAIASLRVELEALKLSHERLMEQNAHLQARVVELASGPAAASDDEGDGDIKLTMAAPATLKKL